MRRRSLGFLIGAAALILSSAHLGACRTPVATEGNLQTQHFLSDQNALTKDPSGRLFGVAARGDVSVQEARFATVTYRDRTHLFLTRPAGERAVELLPLTRMPIDWYNEAMGSNVNLRFIAEPSDEVLSDAVGIWAGGNDRSLRWYGPAPEGRRNALVISAARAPESLSMAANFVGSVAVEGSTVHLRGDVFPPHRGPYIVLVDGFEDLRGPRVAAPESVTLDSEAFSTWTRVEGSPQRLASIADLQQEAARLNAELVIAPTEGGLRFGFGADAGPPGLGPWSLRPAIADSGFVFDDEAGTRSDLQHILRAMEALYRGHVLTAAMHLERASHWSVDGNQESTRLRHQDLISGGGFLAWQRAFLMDGAEGLSPEAALFFARGYSYQGHDRAVEANASRAHELFSLWPAGRGRSGMAAARVLEAHAAAGRGNRSRQQGVLADAANSYERASDPFRAALTKRSSALLEPAPDALREISADLLQVGARFEAQRTLLLGASALLDAGDAPGAHDLLERFAESPDADSFARMTHFHSALTHRLSLSQGDHVERDRLDAEVERSRANRSWEALSVLLTLQDPVFASRDDAQSFGDLLLSASLRSNAAVNPTARGRTFSTLCAELVFPDLSGSSRVAGRCLQQMRRDLRTPEGVEDLVTAGYRLIQRGDLEAARGVAEFLIEGTPTSLAIPRARVFLMEGALLHGADSERTTSAAIQEAFDVLRTAVAPRDAPEILLALADEFSARGFTGHRVALYRAARQAAANANRSSLEFDATLRLAEALYETKRWQDLAELAPVDSPLHSVRIDLLRAQAHHMLENQGSARSIRQAVFQEMREFGELQRVSLHLLESQYALDRGERGDARSSLSSATDLLAGMADGSGRQEDVRVLTARTRALQAEEALRSQDVPVARRYAQQGLEALREVPPQVGPAVRREVLLVALRVAEPGDVDELWAALLAVPSATEGPSARDRQMASRVIDTGLRLGRTGEARELAAGHLAQGFSLGATRDEHFCRLGEVDLLAGSRQRAERSLAICANADDEALAARGALWNALTNHDASPEFRAGLARHLADQLTTDPLDARRLRWMAAYAQPREAPSPELEEELRAAIAEAEPNSPEALGHAAALIDYLLQTGQTEQADGALRAHSGLFYRPDLNAQDQHIRLRLASQLMQLRPLDVLSTVDRLVSEAPPTTEEGQAEVLYLRATARAQIGQVIPALRELAEARSIAPQGTSIAASIQALESALTTAGSTP